jgi:hypothetical protein
MQYKVLSFAVSFILFFSIISVAQRQLTDEEVKTFYKLIKQTKEYKIVKEQVDSANNAGENQLPQKINLGILTKESDAATDDFIFYAQLERSLAIGISLDIYIFQYDRQKKQIVSIKHEKKYELK